MNDDDAQNQQQADQALWAIPSPDWQKWKKAPKAKLWQCAALLCGFEPAAFQNAPLDNQPGTATLGVFFGWPEQADNKFRDKLSDARSAMATGALRALKRDQDVPDESEVNLRDFATWAYATTHTLPEGFPWLPDMDLDIRGWPWGMYQTNYLRKLALAADKFWSAYDPDDSGDAPTNDDVVAFLIQHHVPKSLAQSMATILRADDLPTGRRRK